MALSSLPEIDQRLLEDIRAGNCVAFVGAGFSAAAGLPKWSDLLREVADALPPAGFSDERATLRELLGRHASVSNRELEMAAQLLFDGLGERRCREILNDALKQEPLPEAMLRRLKHLYGIPFRAIVTTNFDPLVPGVPPDPTAYRRLLRMPRHAPWREAVSRAALGIELPLGMADSPDRPVVQLHGTLRDEGSLVFTRAQYRRRLYANPAYLTVLRALLATSTVLFLGYSLRDAYLNELRAELVEAFQGGERRRAGEAERPIAWAVLEDVSEVACAYYEKHEGLGVLPYCTGNGGRDHSGFDAILAHIYSQTNPIHRLGRLLKGRRLMWFDPSPSANELGRRLLTAAVEDVEGRSTGLGEHLVTVTERSEAVNRLADDASLSLIITHWGHGMGPDGRANGEELLRAAAHHRASGRGVAPIVVFAGARHEAENRQRALRLGAVEFTSEWQTLMAVIDRVLGEPNPA